MARYVNIKIKLFHSKFGVVVSFVSEHIDILVVKFTKASSMWPYMCINKCSFLDVCGNYIQPTGFIF